MEHGKSVVSVGGVVGDDFVRSGAEDAEHGRGQLKLVMIIKDEL